MKQYKVFIASSTEGLKITNTIKDLLQNELGPEAEVTPWTWNFELSATYIESLEQVSGEIDFAVMVLTPDDVLTTRKTDKLAPRDNVIFELGLFMGYLGRKRCFIVSEERPDLKIPSDLLGVKAATIKVTAGDDLNSVLKAPCHLISDRIKELGTRWKLDPDTLTAQMTIRNFCTLVEGAWWERINRSGINAISFFWIEPDKLFNSVYLTGKSYNKEGIHVANWKSLIGRVEMDENKILYNWKGWHTQKNLANIPFHGFGELEFDKPIAAGQKLTRGEGKFWDIDEAHPEKTIIKPTQFKRILDDAVISVMTGGNANEIKSVVKKTLDEW
jgi:hypothetical protein